MSKRNFVHFKTELLLPMQFKSAFDENTFAVAANQLITARRAALDIVSPMMKLTKQRIAVMASHRGRALFIKVSWSTDLDADKYLPADMDLRHSATVVFHHVLSRNFAYITHYRNFLQNSVSLFILQLICY